MANITWLKPRLVAEIALTEWTEEDFAVLVKLYGADPGSETRYSPAVCVGTKTQTVTGDPTRSTFRRPTWRVRI